jgi:general secretion pathway protein G
MTLIEIMIVLIIVGGLMAVLGKNVMSSLFKANRKQAEIQIKEIGKQLDMFYADCGFYPESLNSLVEKPGDCANWGPEPYLKKLPKDPWSSEFVYERKSKSEYALISLGADHQEGGSGNDEDISSENL